MKIYTKTGDKGDTGLLYGGRVPKDHARIEAYGTTDEVVSALGMARAHLQPDDRLFAAILEVQRELFIVGAQLATDPERWAKLRPGESKVEQSMVEALQDRIDAVVDEHPLPDGFVVPGDNPVAAALDLARTITRRAERAVVHLVREDLLPDETILRYVNRLSDYLYVLARSAEGEAVPSREPG